MPFMQAVETIMGNVAVSPPTYFPAPKEQKPKVLLLPKANRCATHVVEYLRGRGIDYDLIDFCISTERLYESYPYHNVVFVGQDRSGKPRYANLRGIGSDFIGDANGSDKHYSFGIPAANESGTLNLFESAVDLLSYGTMADNFYGTGAYSLRRIDPQQTEKDTCTYCNQRKGYDYEIIPKNR